MNNFILIGVCILAGMIFRATKSIHPEAYKGINTWVLYLALPAVSFKYLPQIELTSEVLFPVISAVIVALGSNWFMFFYNRYKSFSERSRRTLELASGYSNTSFIGFPLVAAFFGEEYLAIAALCDQAMFVTVSSFGLVTALKGGSKTNEKLTPKFLLKKLFSFPPFLGCIAALGLSPFIDFSPAEPLFGMLASTVAPMALFAIGLQLQFTGWKKLRSQISMSLLYKLMLAPALVTLAALLLGLQGDIPKISVFESAMPTLVTSSVIAEQYGLNMRLINLIIGVSIIVCFATLSLWYLILEALF